MNEKHLENFRKMIQKETISLPGMTDKTKFREFHKLLAEIFPSLWAVSTVEDFNGSLLIRWPGKEVGQPVLFMNHHDVVEENGVWPDHAPFSADVADGRVWGRGTLDTKGGLWGMLQAADDLVAEGFTPAHDIYFESACNEELGGAEGACVIADELERRGIRFKYVLDEGSFIVNDVAGFAIGEKGVNELKFIARSAGGHASMPPKDTPLVRLGRFMAYVDDNRDTLFPVEINKETGSKQYTSCAFTMAEGAKARNVLPREASVITSVRTSHHQGVEGSYKALEDAAKKFDIEMEILDKGFTTPITDTNSEGYKLIAETTLEQFPGVTIKPAILTGATDARYMCKIADAVVRFIPFRVDIPQIWCIHSANENVFIDSLDPGCEFYKALMKK